MTVFAFIYFVALLVKDSSKTMTTLPLVSILFGASVVVSTLFLKGTKLAG